MKTTQHQKRLAMVSVLVMACVPAISAGCAHSLGGAFKGRPEHLKQQLSPAALVLVERSFSDLGDSPVIDYHAHIVGVGTNNGAEVNRKMRSWLHPTHHAKYRVYLSACGIGDLSRADEEYVSRLVRLLRGFGHPAKAHILALDRYYNPDGTINREKTEFYVPNEYVVRLANQYPDVLEPVISVHPYRHDAVEELERWAKSGVRYVKWLPNAQGIDPSDPRNDAFYRAMREHDMVLLTHTGKEMAVDAADAQEWGNPLRLRRPLDLGVKVIMAHCASLGRSSDLDNPGRDASNVDLFFRMMDDKKYRGLLFADISATTQMNRTPRPILELIGRPDLQGRLVNGSDYPIPAVNCLISTRKLARLGMITHEEQRCLNEIYNCNPLLFDFVLKRTLHDPATGKRLPACVLLENGSLTPPPRGVAADGYHSLVPRENEGDGPHAKGTDSERMSFRTMDFSVNARFDTLVAKKQQNGGRDDPH